MPNTSAAKKALRQNARRREMNAYHLGPMRTLTRDLKKYVEAKKIKEARETLVKLYKVLDKASKHGTIKKNSAARKKSRLTKLVNKNSAK